MHSGLEARVRAGLPCLDFIFRLGCAAKGGFAAVGSAGGYNGYHGGYHGYGGYGAMYGIVAMVNLVIMATIIKAKQLLR